MLFIVHNAINKVSCALLNGDSVVGRSLLQKPKRCRGVNDAVTVFFILWHVFESVYICSF